MPRVEARTCWRHPAFRLSDKLMGPLSQAVEGIVYWPRRVAGSNATQGCVRVAIWQDGVDARRYGMSLLSLSCTSSHVMTYYKNSAILKSFFITYLRVGIWMRRKCGQPLDLIMGHYFNSVIVWHSLESRELICR